MAFEGRISIDDRVEAVKMPENVRIGLMVDEHRKRCGSDGCQFDYSGFAFGQSPFSVPPTLSNALADSVENGQYSSSTGVYELREAIAKFSKRYFDLHIEPESVVVGHGTKGLFFVIFSMIQGGVVIPSPSWVSYVPQLEILGKDYHILHTDPYNDYKVMPDELESFLAGLERNQHLLILNSPNNPTGAVYSRRELERIAEVCREHNILVLSDEIYALTTFEEGSFTSMYGIFPEGTFATNGLAKSFSAGGYRIGYSLLPQSFTEEITNNFKKLAATVYTNVSTPTQYAAATAFRPHEEMDSYFRVTREIHRIMGIQLSAMFNRIEGLRATCPKGGFYFFVDFNGVKDKLIANGVATSNDLMQDMIKHPHHIALISGDSCLLRPDDFGARIAYVDYDGDAAMKAYQEERPRTPGEEYDFFLRLAPKMVDGVERVRTYLDGLKGKDGE